MQTQERIGLSTAAGIASSISPLNGSSSINIINNNNNNNKEVISPNSTMSPAVAAHNRSKSSNSIPNERLGSAIPLVRSRTAPQAPPAPPQIQPSHSDSSDIDDWNDWPQSNPTTAPQPQHDPSDPDSQEQALFEQRLCEDIYGVAVRKINQNGKSNLRYVKCLYVDASEVLHNEESNSNAPQHFSSNRSVSSRHSRGSRVSFSRFLGGSSNHNKNSNISYDNDAHRSLLREIEKNDSDLDTNKSYPINGKVRVLSWGKKKDVMVPLHKFTAVKKGKVDERSRRNPCHSSRILSLVTSDIHSTNERNNSNSVSLDIEAPTRLDRDKFAKAFATFLNVPVIEADEIIRAPRPQAQVSTAFPNQQSNHRPLSPQLSGTDGNRSIARSIKSDITPQSWKEPQRQSISSSINNDHLSIPEIALTTSNSQTTNERGGRDARSSSWKQLKAPLPVVTTGKASATKPPRNNRRSTSSASGGVVAPPIHMFAVNSNAKIHNISRPGVEVEDPPQASLASSTRSRGASNKNTGVSNTISASDRNKTISSSPTGKNGKLVLEIPITTNSKLSKNSNSNHDRSTSISAQPLTPATETHTDTNVNNISRDTTTDDSDGMDGSVVSSITGVAFDQDLVEELHLALERMKAELEESRAEASRAVKVAEQAIQSAENSNSKDWNNTVTHKAAEAAATAQKKSAEAMAKARIAEEKLDIERKNGAVRKKQVQQAEQQAAHWQTRAAAAEVQRFAVAEALESERKKNQELLLQAENSLSSRSGSPSRQHQTFGAFETAASKAKSSSPTRMNTSTEWAEVDRLRSKLAMESARRRKLLDELQDLRGSIRVYCRLKEPSYNAHEKPTVVDMVSNEVLMLHRNHSSSVQEQIKVLSNTASSSSSSPATPLCFEFDGILAPDMSQQDVYVEFEAICSSVVEGFKICVMSYGQTDSGKTHTILGDVRCDKADHSVTIENEGIHLRAMKQLFSLLERRQDRFMDTVTMNLVEVHDEKLIDLLAGTDFGEQHGKVENRKSSRRSATAGDDTKSPPRKFSDAKPKLEIKTNREGETVVRGVLSVDLVSYDDVLRVWTDSMSKRSSRLAEQGVEDPLAYEKNSHVVATLKVTSKNLSTGLTATGRMQFVDFASSEVTMKRPLGSSGGVSSFLATSSSSKRSSSSTSDHLLDDRKFTNKSLNAFREVVLARSQYQRSVPYRNSTITHILSDSLEADTKVVLIACVSANEDDLTNTACTLQMAQEMRKVVVGKATRHTTNLQHTGGSSHQRC